MREIKFRAWDGKKMRYHEYESYVMMFDGTIGHFNGRTYDTVNWELMQYTGLKDKNGKEIYEGDIVKKEETETKSYIGEVFFASVRCAFAIRHDVHTPYPRYDDLVKCKWSESDVFYIVDPDGDKDSTKEVIGNIYENPDLLK